VKILFLNNDPVHAWPVLRARPYASSLGIEIDAHQEASPQSALKYLCGSYDLLLIHQELMSDDVLTCGRPVAILERIDGAQLGTSRRWISDVAAIWKGYSFVDPRDHNRYRGRRHAHQLKAAGIDAFESVAIPGRPEPQLSDSDLTKIQTWFGFGAYQKEEHLWTDPVDYRAPRPVPVHFAGTVEYNGSEVETHRRYAELVAAAVPGGIGKSGRPFRKGEYAATMRKSKTVLCPFGWGESAHRDYEAMLLGCVVLKPDCSAIDCWPNIYVDGETYIKCREDFADVPEIVERIAADWRCYRNMRQHCRRLALESGNAQRIAERLADLAGRVV
jgi:hypothetical protein